MANNVNWYNVTGDKTLENGGYAGDLLQLGRVHLDEAASNGRVTNEEYGKVISTMISSAYTQAIAFELLKELRESEITVAYEQVVIEQLKQAGLIVEHDTARYELTYVKPEELRLIQSKIVSESKGQALIDEKIKTEHAVVGKTEAERDSLRFDMSNMKPKELELMTAKVETSKYEQDLMEQKSLAEKIKNGLQALSVPTNAGGQSGTILTTNSLHTQQIETAESQTDLLKRQETAFDDVQLQKVFDSQIRYSSMIYQDNPNPDVLEMGQDVHVSNIYNAMADRINREPSPVNVPKITECEITDGGEYTGCVPDFNGPDGEPIPDPVP